MIKALILAVLMSPTVRVNAAVHEVVLHLDPPKEGTEIREILDISQIVKVGEPQVLPAAGLMLYTDEMAGTMEELNNIILDHGPVTLKILPEEPVILAIPHNVPTVLTIEPSFAARRYDDNKRRKFRELAERWKDSNMEVILELLRFVDKHL